MTFPETLINKNLDQIGLFKKSQATFPWFFHKFALVPSASLRTGSPETWLNIVN